MATDQHLMLALSFSGHTNDENKVLHTEIEVMEYFQTMVLKVSS